MNAQFAAGPPIKMDTLACAFTHYASMSSHGVTRSVPEKKALALAKSDKPMWDTQKEPFHTFKRGVMIWAESLKIEHLLTGPPLGDVRLNAKTQPAASFYYHFEQHILIILLTQPICMKHGTLCLIAMSLPGQSSV